MPSQTVTDTVGTLHALPVMWGWMLGAVGDDAFAAGAPSARELANATNEVLAVAGGEDVRLNRDGVGVIDTMARLVPFAAANTNAVATDEDAVALLDGVTELFHRAGRAVHSAGAGADPQHGTVDRVNASDGGVPKRSIGRAEVTARGLVDDRQASRRHHGKPMQALCLYSTQLIEALAREDHPIGPGTTGENVTISGLEWDALRPGVRLRVGTVLAEVSAAATPCDKNAQWFVDGAYRRIDQAEHPGWSRLYAWVLEPGVIAEGDVVTVEP